MPDVEVHIDLEGTPRLVGLLRRHVARRTETMTFAYDDSWLADQNRFSIEPALALTRGIFPAPNNQAIFGSIGDSAPDSWGRRLMQRAERRAAEKDCSTSSSPMSTTICAITAFSGSAGTAGRSLRPTISIRRRRT